jgi:XTP/dITP diphosphohydrolase
VATRNSHKTRELRELLGNAFALEDLTAHPEMPEISETGVTFEENATIKALAISKLWPELVLADDSGMEVDALGGAPGVFSARYAGENATDKLNVEKLLNELKHKEPGVGGLPTARFRCVIALARSGRLIHSVEGVVEGNIVEHPRGTAGFGYDPIFQPEGYDKTFGELSAAIKNQISHRARAAAALRDYLSLV